MVGIYFIISIVHVSIAVSSILVKLHRFNESFFNSNFSSNDVAIIFVDSSLSQVEMLILSVFLSSDTHVEFKSSGIPSIFAHVEISPVNSTISGCKLYHVSTVHVLISHPSYHVSFVLFQISWMIPVSS
jgi:hypothetical protein